MGCPNCESNNTLRLAGEYNSCVQCGYEDYTSIARPKYKSNGLHYKARYDGDVESQAKVFKSNTLHKGFGPKKDNVRFNLNIIFRIE